MDTLIRSTNSAKVRIILQFTIALIFVRNLIRRFFCQFYKTQNFQVLNQIISAKRLDSGLTTQRKKY